MILYGVLVGQVLQYYEQYKRDKLWLRYFVLFIFVVESSNTMLDIGMVYEPLILHYGEVPDLFPTVFVTQPICVVLVSMPIQFFFAYRINRLTNSLWLPVIICVFALASFAGGLWTAAMIVILKEFAKKRLATNAALLWFLGSCVTDVLIASSLVFTLMRSKTGFPSTDSVVNKLIRMTIQTGLVTAVFSILDVICFMVLPETAVNFVWDMALSKLYATCFLSTLNARAAFAERMLSTIPVTDSIGFGQSNVHEESTHGIALRAPVKNTRDTKSQGLYLEA